jgi:small subunit ribosomal protein S16
MAVKIRLSRIGKTNRPYWRVVAVDSRKKRDGAFLDNLGTYDPINNTLIQFHQDRINHWTSNGAICSPTVRKLIRLHKRNSSSEKATMSQK